MDSITAAGQKIDQIQALLDQMQKSLDQEKADIANLNWPDVGSLSHVAAKLQEIDTFWRDLED